MSDTLFLTAALLLLIGALGLYFYSKVSYIDRKLNYVESILIDLRMKQEMERRESAPLPVPLKSPEPLQTGDSEELKDEKEFYASVIESVAGVQENTESNDEVNDATNVVTPDYDSMNRDEVAAIAEKKSIRVTKRMNKSTLINLLRESEKNASATVEIGKDGGAPIEAASSAAVGSPDESS
jgi:hypothetical protein